MDTFEELVSAAEREPFQGWNFAYIRGRYEQAQPSWNYHELVLERLGRATSLLDLGTGGGEFLSSLGRLPPTACATEGYPPNTKVALANLRSRGVSIVQTFCEDEWRMHRRGALPFRTESFDLVIDRHESYIPEEVLRVLKKTGQFVTQQVGERNNAELRQLFGVSERTPAWNLARATDELDATGFRVLARGESIARSRFLDVGAVVYLLKAVPWDFPDFSTSRFEKELREIHSVILQKGSFDVTTARFYLVASKD